MGRVPAIAAPTAAPTKPASDMGVLRTRTGPNLSMRPLVAPNALRITSSPITKVSGSRSISSTSAELIAWMKLICGIVAASLVGVDVVGYFGDIGQLALAREFDRILEFGGGFLIDAIEFGLVDLPAADEKLLIPDDGAFELPGLDFRGRTIRALAEERCLAHHVPFPAVGFAFEERGTLAGARACDRLAGEAENFHHIVTVDDETGDVVALRALRDIADRGHRLHRREFAVTVVLAYEDHRQFPHRGEVERFVEGAFIGCAVAEEARSHVVLAGNHRGERRAGRNRQAAADDAVGAENAERVVDDMHRAALAFAVAGAFAVELRHHAVELA